MMYKNYTRFLNNLKKNISKDIFEIDFHTYFHRDIKYLILTPKLNKNFITLYKKFYLNFMSKKLILYIYLNLTTKLNKNFITVKM